MLKVKEYIVMDTNIELKSVTKFAKPLMGIKLECFNQLFDDGASRYKIVVYSIDLGFKHSDVELFHNKLKSKFQVTTVKEGLDYNIT